MNVLKRALRAYALPLQIMVRPFSGFYAMKFENQGTLKLAFFNFFMVVLSVTFTRQYSSILVNPRHPLAVNSIWELITLSVLLVLFCASNWAVTSLTDGEGRFKDILMATCYAMTPIIMIFIPAALFSNVLTLEEAAFYNMIISVAVAWFVFLVFAGLVTVHNYSPGKAIATVFLTFVAILVIAFLISLMFTLIQQLVVFVRSLYTELVFRA